MSIILLFLSVFLFYFSGYGLSYFLLDEEFRRFRLIFMPIIGMALLVVLLENLGFLGMEMDKSAYITLGLISAGNFVTLHNR